MAGWRQGGSILRGRRDMGRPAIGNFYENVTVKGPTRDWIVAHLKEAGCRAYVGPSRDSVTAIVSDRCDIASGRKVMDFAMALSQALSCPALAVMNHDDDILAYWLFENGAIRDEYDSDPDYFSGGDSPPKGGDAGALCRALGCPGDATAVEGVLRRAGGNADDGYVFAFEQHQALLDALGIQHHAVGLRWKYVERGEFPIGTTEADFIKV